MDEVTVDVTSVSSPSTANTMHKLLSVLAAVALTAAAAAAQPADKSKTSGIGHPSVAAALEAMRTKSGVRVSTQSGWTVIDDKATMSVWSFTPAGHPAHPTAVHRMVVKEGDNIAIQMQVLCEATKPACDKLVAEFQEMNNKMRESLSGKRAP